MNPSLKKNVKKVQRNLVLCSGLLISIAADWACSLFVSPGVPPISLQNYERLKQGDDWKRSDVQLDC